MLIKEFLFALVSAVAQAQSSPTLTGRVLDAVTGLPIPDAQVTLMGVPAGVVRSVQSDAGGRFTYDQLRPGSYSVQARHPHYPGPLGLPQPARLFTVEPGEEPSAATLRLAPAGVLSGRVVADDGEPLAGCSVQIFRHPLGSGPVTAAAQTESGEDGEFRFADLAPDRYLLGATCPESLPVERLLDHAGTGSWAPAATWEPVYYPQSPTRQGATPIAVSSGTNRQVELRTAPTPIATVRGTIEPSPSPAILLAPAGEAGSPLYEFRTTTTGGAFEFHRVPPGAYVLYTAFTRQPVEVGATDPPPLRVPAQEGATLSGQVLLPSEPATPPLVEGFSYVSSAGPKIPRGAPPVGIVEVTPVDAGPWATKQSAEVNGDDGAFTIPGLPPGTWRIRYQGYLTRGFVEAVEYGTPTADRDIIRITAGAGPPLIIRVGAAFPDLVLEGDSPSGTLRSVYAVPEHTAGDRNHLLLTVPPDIPLRLARLVPGRYRIFAIAHHGELGPPDERLIELLRRQVAAVEAVAGERQTIALQVFTSADVYRLANAYIAGEAQ